MGYLMLLILTLTSLNSFIYSLPPTTFTKEGQSVSGKWCLNDCVGGLCVVDIETVEYCNYSDKPAPTYYTTGQKHSDQSVCSTRCQVLMNDRLPQCFVGNSWRKLDYCNPELTKTFENRDFTFNNGPCANDCNHNSTSSTANTGNCNDSFGALRGCYIDKYFYETVTSLSGHRCNGICARHEGKKYNWCRYDISNWDYCAHTALNNRACHKCESPIRQKRQVNNETVYRYAERMERDPRYRTERPNDPNNPIYSYTYNQTTTPSGQIIRLPLVVRARIYRSNIQPSNSRVSGSISSDARTNCRRMGMTGTDAVGHLIAYKLGGPSGFYNFVPMTQAINIGSVSNGNVYAPSVWAATERGLAYFVGEQDGTSTVTVVLRYDRNHPLYPYRPVRIGWAQENRNFNGDSELTCTNYWYNNEYDAEDPECDD